MRNHDRKTIYSGLIGTAAAVFILFGQAAAAETETPSQIMTAQKEETVYVISDPAGSVDRIIVSDWLKNTGLTDTLEDKTILSDIENLKGDETFTESEDGGICWEAGGKDIFYQGTADKELPVTISVTALLDGDEISPQELEGKSGKLTIRWQYENHAEKKVTLEEEESTLHVPFAALTAFMPDENIWSDLEVTNGRALSDGEHTLVIGMAFPGVAEDLKMPAYAQLTGLGDAQVPDYVEITGQVQDFTWNTAYTLITNELFSEEGADLSALFDGLFGKLGGLKSGVSQITSGVSSFDDGAKSLKNASKKLAGGLGELTDRQDALLEGAGQILEEALEAADSRLKEAGIETETLTMENYADLLGELQKEAGEPERQVLTAVLEKLTAAESFYTGLVSYTDGVSSAKDAADELASGAAALKGNSWELSLGAGILNAAIPDFSNVSEALKETSDLGAAYDNYSGIADGMTGKVRFIWKQ
jgi:putative membrane protein